MSCRWGLAGQVDTSEIELPNQPVAGAVNPLLSRTRQLRTLKNRRRIAQLRRNLALRRGRRQKRQSLGGFAITHNNEAFLPFCLGDFLPGISEEFPNQALELRYKSNAPPTFFFQVPLQDLNSLS